MTRLLINTNPARFSTSYALVKMSKKINQIEFKKIIVFYSISLASM
jgi:hypothetical protein